MRLGFGVFVFAEQSGQGAEDALHREIELFEARGFASEFPGGEIAGDGVAELGGAAETLGGKQGQDGVRVAMLELALLPFLDGPGGFADVVDGVAKFDEDAGFDFTGAHGLLELHKFGAGFLELEINAPKGFAGNQQLDSDANRSSLCGPADRDDASAKRFLGQQVGQFNFTADAGKRLHIEEAAQRVHFYSLRVRLDTFAGGVLPFCFQRNDDRETDAAAPFESKRGRIVGRGFHDVGPPELVSVLISLRVCVCMCRDRGFHGGLESWEETTRPYSEARLKRSNIFQAAKEMLDRFSRASEYGRVVSSHD